MGKKDMIKKTWLRKLQKFFIRPLFFFFLHTSYNSSNKCFICAWKINMYSRKVFNKLFLKSVSLPYKEYKPIYMQYTVCPSLILSKHKKDFHKNIKASLAVSFYSLFVTHVSKMTLLPRACPSNTFTLYWQLHLFHIDFKKVDELSINTSPT